MAEFPPIPGVEHRFVQAGGIRMHVAEAGSGEPVVLLHGWPQHHYVWRHVIPLLADRFRVIAPDLRGFGWSDAPRTSYSKRELADDVLALLDTLEIDQGVRLAGHDWGGYVAFLAALDAPARFRSLTAMGIIHPWSATAPRPQDVVLVYQPLVATPVLGALLQQRTPLVDLVFKVSDGGDLWSDEERRAFSEQFREADRAEAASRVYRTFLTKELFEQPPPERLTVPTRLIIGREDPVVHLARAEGFEAHADRMELELVDAGHWLPEEVPELVAERIAAG